LLIHNWLKYNDLLGAQCDWQGEALNKVAYIELVKK